MSRMLEKPFYFTLTHFIKNIVLSSYEEYFYYTIMFIALFVGYLFAKPITYWLISLKSVRLLSYLLNSLFILLTMLFILLTIDELNHLLVQLFRIFLQCLACFGVILILYKLFFKRQKKQGNY